MQVLETPLNKNEMRRRFHTLKVCLFFSYVQYLCLILLRMLTCFYQFFTFLQCVQATDL